MSPPDKLCCADRLIEVKIFGQRGLFVDQIQNFKKIKLSKAERKLRHVQSTCKGCGK